MAEWVFGYASLVEDHRGSGSRTATLRGFRRLWGVASDNSRDIPGYKTYRSRSDGSRPAVFVAFLDVDPDPGAEVTGLVRAVDAAALAALDARERNYDRIDVSDRVPGVEGVVWTYRGSAAGRERLATGRAENTVVVSRDYLDKVRRGLAAMGADHEMPEPPPVLDLDRLEVPA